MAIAPLSSAMMSSLSGLLTAGLRLDAAASNIANMKTTGSLPGSATQKAAYAPVTVEASALPGPDGTGGVTGYIRPILPAQVQAYEPDARYATRDGMVAAPNVDPLEEMVSMEEASLAYKLNLAVYKTAADMVRSLYDDVKHD